jgi:hypothetical protein
VNGNLANTNSLDWGGSVNVTGDVTNSGVAELGNGSIGGTFNNIGRGLVDGFGFGNLSAAHYVQTGNHTEALVEGTWNVPDARVNGGSFWLFGTMNGNLQVAGATFGPQRSENSVLNGNFTIDSSSTYQENFFEGFLAVSGDASLAGTMHIIFYGPQFRDGETIPVMTYLAETGQFGTIDFRGLGPGQTVTLEYGSTELDAVVHGQAPPLAEPTSLFLMGTGVFALACRFRRKFAAK